MSRTLPKHTKRNIPMFLIIIILVVGLSACNSRKNSVEKSEEIMEAFFKAWVDKDGEALMSMYSDDTIGFDAMAPGWSYDKEYAEVKSKSEAYWTGFNADFGTYFVSPDGSFIAHLATVDYAGIGKYPISSIYALTDQKISFSYDYYGGSFGEPGNEFSIEPRTADPDSEAAKSSVIIASDTVQKWRTSFNDRNADAFLSCFSEDAIYVDVVYQEWRIMSITDLTADVNSNFQRQTFKSRIEASEKSPLPDGCFVSADGHYAAAQGYFFNEGIRKVPMMIILEIKDGLILKQYNYMLIENSILQQ